MKCPVTTLENKKAGEIELDDAVFAVPPRRDILARLVNWQLAKRRAGTHKVKTRGEIQVPPASSSARKAPATRAWARQPHDPAVRGGATVLRSGGPRSRSHRPDQEGPQAGAARRPCRAKAAEGKLVIVEDVAVKEPKTGELAKKFEASWAGPRC